MFVGYFVLEVPRVLVLLFSGVESMGGGDIKYLAAVGAWQGATSAFAVLTVAALGAFALAGGSRLVTKKAGHIAFGPYLVAAAIANALAPGCLEEGLRQLAGGVWAVFG